MAQIFISYSHADKCFAHKLADDLINLGLNVWIDRDGLEVVDELNERIEDELRNCDSMIVIISENSKNSYVQKELNFFLDNKSRSQILIPIYYKEIANLKAFFPDDKERLYIDFRDSDPKAKIPKNYDVAFKQLRVFLQSKKILHPLYSRLIELANKYSREEESAVEEARLELLKDFRELLSTKGYACVAEKSELLIDYINIDLANNFKGNKLLIKIRFWLEDSLILVFPKSDDYINDLKRKITARAPLRFELKDLDQIAKIPNEPDLVHFYIDFRNEYIRGTKEEQQATDNNLGSQQFVSLVAQCMFVICHQNGILYTIHDRSYAGAADRLSEYAMITGRLRAKDLPNPILPGGLAINSACKNNLIRELQELDELGLPDDIVTEYVNDGPVLSNVPAFYRTQFIGIYESRDRNVLSFLFAIFVTVDEYNGDLTKLGPYLIPISPKEFSRLHTLNLLNDILLRNTCNKCIWNGEGNLVCGRRLQEPCIIRDIERRIVPAALGNFAIFDENTCLDENIVKYRTKLDCNSVFMAIDIPNYSLLNATIRDILRTDLRNSIVSFLDNENYNTHHQETSTGYIIELSSIENTTERRSDIALLAYFYSLYLSIFITEWKSFQSPEEVSKVDICIALQTADHSNGINQALDIVEVGHPRQILCSQSYIMQLLEAIIQHSNGDIVYLNEAICQDEKKEYSLWSSEKLSQILKNINLGFVFINQITRDEHVSKCFEDRGLPVSDIGVVFMQHNRSRYRVFNLKIYSSDPHSVKYGNLEQPSALIPIIYRADDKTKKEYTKLLESLQYAEHLMMYGFSNVQVMRGFYKKYIQKSTSITLKSFKIIFYDYAQYKDLNDPRSIKITQANWIRGFLYAQQIARVLQKNTRKLEECTIGINSTRYGFNVFKVIYSINAPVDHKDQIRFTVPMPGSSFERSPLFIINRGDPLYHNFLEICNKYVEKGIKENNYDFSIRTYRPNTMGYELLDRLFEKTPTAINKVTKEDYDNILGLMKNNKTKAIKYAKDAFGEYYMELLEEEDFTDAYHLWQSLQILEENSSDDKDLKVGEKEFNHHEFLEKYFSG